MKPIGSTWKRTINCNTEPNSVWEVLEYSGRAHVCKRIIATDNPIYSDVFNFLIDDEDLWEPYETKSNNFKTIYDILNEN